MWGYGAGMMGNSGFGLFGIVTWVALIVFLILGSLYFWKEINKKK